MVDNRVHHARTKHMLIKENFVQEKKQAGVINPQYIPTELNLSDGQTKPLARRVIDFHTKALTGNDPIYD